jgi:hypothetical protein
MKICKLPFGETTPDGAYYIKLNGHNIGFDGKTHFQTKEQAQ